MSSIIKKIIAAIACICAIAGAACFFWEKYARSPRSSLTLYGNVDIRQVDLGFRVAGRIAETLVDEGEAVAAGQPMSRIDKDILIQQRDQAAARVANEQANLARLERGYRVEDIAQARAAVAAAGAVAENAGTNLRRVQALRRDNAISQKELDNAMAQNREAKAHLRSAQSNLDMLLSGYRKEEILAQKAALAAAAANLNLADIRVRDAELKSPQNGIVLTRAREAGAIVQEGQTVYTLTLTDPVWLRAYVAEPDLGLIKPGMPVKIGVDAAPGKLFDGTVGFISPSAEFTPKTVETKEVRSNLVYRIRVQAEDPDNVMRQGMPVTIHIDLAQK